MGQIKEQLNKLQLNYYQTIEAIRTVGKYASAVSQNGYSDFEKLNTFYSALGYFFEDVPGLQSILEDATKGTRLGEKIANQVKKDWDHYDLNIRIKKLLPPKMTVAEFGPYLRQIIPYHTYQDKELVGLLRTYFKQGFSKPKAIMNFSILNSMTVKNAILNFPEVIKIVNAQMNEIDKYINECNTVISLFEKEISYLEKSINEIRSLKDKIQSTSDFIARVQNAQKETKDASFWKNKGVQFALKIANNIKKATGPINNFIQKTMTYLSSLSTEFKNTKTRIEKEKEIYVNMKIKLTRFKQIITDKNNSYSHWEDRVGFKRDDVHRGDLYKIDTLYYYIQGTNKKNGQLDFNSSALVKAVSKIPSINERNLDVALNLAIWYQASEVFYERSGMTGSGTLSSFVGARSKGNLLIDQIRGFMSFLDSMCEDEINDFTQTANDEQVEAVNYFRDDKNGIYDDGTKIPLDHFEHYHRTNMAFIINEAVWQSDIIQEADTKNGFLDYSKIETAIARSITYYQGIIDKKYEIIKATFSGITSKFII